MLRKLPTTLNQQKSMNNEQMSAINYKNGPMYVAAGPGSGKTRVIVERIKQLVASGTEPSRVLAMTFTRKAASEMLDRLSKHSDVESMTTSESASDEPYIGTFHQFCHTHLKVHQKYKIIDPETVQYILQSIITQELKACEAVTTLTYKLTYKDVLSYITWKKYTLGDDGALPIPPFITTVNRSACDSIFRTYVARCVRENLKDFDDLLIDMNAFLHTSNGVKVTELYDHILVDEFQDTSTVQYEIVKSMASLHRNITIVGDCNQSIYSWRFANSENVQRFFVDFEDVKTVSLVQNYRSTKSIIDYSTSLLKRVSTDDTNLKFSTPNIRGESIKYKICEDGYKEGEMIVNLIKLATLKKYKLSDVAILIRVHDQRSLIENALKASNIPYRMVDDVSFYERDEIRDILSYMLAASDPSNILAVLRIMNKPPRRIGTTVVKEVTEKLQHMKNTGTDTGTDTDTNTGAETGVNILHVDHPKLIPFQSLLGELGSIRCTIQLFDQILLKTDYMTYLRGKFNFHQYSSKVQKINELRRIVEQFPTTGDIVADVRELIHTSILRGGSDTNHDMGKVGESTHTGDIESDIESDIELDIPKVTISTIHGAKGLEWPVVFIPGCEDNILPHLYRGKDSSNIDEERRLFYVAMTRAKELLVISRAKNRKSWKGNVSNSESQFLRENPIK